MRERPILFSAPMVRAILAGTKTQTRRIVKCPAGTSEWVVNPERDGKWWPTDGDDYVGDGISCPYGAPGDRLWVRETWRSWRSTCDEDNVDDDHECYEHCDQTYVAYRATPRVGYRPVPDRAAITYLDESSSIESDRRLLGPWKPGIHMPRWASRITLEITGVRVERLQAITPAAAEAEGIGFEDTRCDGECGATPCALAVPRFADLWRKINGAESWDANPWVWVVEFKRVIEPIRDLIDRSSIGAGLRNIRENGIEAELRSIDEESRLLPGERVDFKAAGKELRRRTR